MAEPITQPQDPGGEQLVVRCTCGWETTGTEAEVVEATQAHGRALHNMEASREDVLAMSSPQRAAS